MITAEEKLQLIQAVANHDSSLMHELTDEERDTARALFDRLFPEPELDVKSLLSTAWLQAIRQLRRNKPKMAFSDANAEVQRLFATFNSHNASDR